MSTELTQSPDVFNKPFLDRDPSWLEFNRRVLHEAQDERTPLLDRIRFLGIFTSNLDEFFMKRIGLMKREMKERTLSDFVLPELKTIREMVLPMLREQARLFNEVLKPKLAENNIHLLAWKELNPDEQAKARKYFTDSVFPVLTPLAVDPGSPFPLISNLSTSLGVILHHPDRMDPLFARVKVPETLPQWVSVGAGTSHRYVPLHEIILHNLHDLFPDMAIVDVMLFRMTRNADLERDEEDVEDLRKLMEDELRQRRFADAVRLEYGPDPNPWIKQFLLEELELTDEDVYELDGELDYTDLKVIADLPFPALKAESWTPAIPAAFADEGADLFQIIRKGEILVHHPYESFQHSVERFVKAAAADPKVLAIKMTLYRTGDMSPFMSSLMRAAESRKQVACLVELKARFDEERNIRTAHMLESAGVHVVYGIMGLKTHCKTCLVVREDADGIRCYAHIGTGNYHAVTSRLYTDFGLFTCDTDITRDLIELFNYLTGRSLKREYRKLLVAPANMKARFIEMIEREIQHAKAGRPAQIIAKMNSLAEKAVNEKLYEASRAGVKIDLIVRGMCTIRPGVPGMSENIKVISVIGRFLEHSRIFYFRNGQEDPTSGEFFIGSADWMYRNLEARVEAITPIERRSLRQRLYDLLLLMLRDNRQAWDMQPNGTYVQRTPQPGEPVISTHQTMMNLHRGTTNPRDEPMLFTPTV